MAVTRNPLILLLCLATASASQTLQLPDRSDFSLTGSQLVSVLSPLGRAEREERIFREVLEGNVPAFLRQLVPITYSISGKSITVYVTPDYMALGSDDDHFLMPMGGPLAQRVANFLNCSMPTRPLVDRIYAAASLKLRAQPIPWSDLMITVPVFWQHMDSVSALRIPQLTAHPLGTLVGGHKKDVILSHKIYEELKTLVPKPVVIYGWNWADGSVIQPVYNGHVEWYADYSHGIRLVSDTVLVDGVPHSYRSLLTDPGMYSLVADTKPLTKPYYASPTRVDGADEGQPQGFRLFQNYPNPFNPATVIRFEIAVDSRQSAVDRDVRLSVYDLLGREVEVLVDAPLTAGEHTVTWDGGAHASGVYVCRMAVSGHEGTSARLTRRMVLLR